MGLWLPNGTGSRPLGMLTGADSSVQVTKLLSIVGDFKELLGEEMLP